MKQWEEVSKEEQEITVKRSEGREIESRKGARCTGTDRGAGTDEQGR